jgi:hypothetical protein
VTGSTVAVAKYEANAEAPRERSNLDGERAFWE